MSSGVTETDYYKARVDDEYRRLMDEMKDTDLETE